MESINYGDNNASNNNPLPQQSSNLNDHVAGLAQRRLRNRTDINDESVRQYSPKSARRKRPTIRSSLWNLVRRLRQTHLFQLLLQLIRKHHCITFLIVLSIPFILRPSRLFRWYPKMFGDHPIGGGYLGRKIDYWALQRVYERTKQRTTLPQLEALGIDVLEEDERLDVLRLHTHAALGEILLRRERRAKTLVALEKSAKVYQKQCQKAVSNNKGSHCGIPRALFVPNLLGWELMRPGKVKNYQSLVFDELEMRNAVQDIDLSLVATFDSLSSIQDKIQLWSLCAVYYYGGVFVGDRLTTCGQPCEDWLLSNAAFSQTIKTLAIVVLEKTKDDDHTMQIHLLVATPRHALFGCILDSLKEKSGFNIVSVLENVLTNNCGAAGVAEKCCQVSNNNVVQVLPEEVASVSGLEGHVLWKVLEGGSKAVKSSVPSVSTVSVEIRQAANMKLPKMTQKITLESRLKEKGAEPGWACTRCIRSPLGGNIKKCPFCPPGYEDLICYSPDIPEKTEVPIDVVVRSVPNSESRAIPRIIHQTWFEDMSIDRYPQIIRLQNSWKNSGWDYRFYNDETAKQYVKDNFPQRFVDAFDAVIPGAYKADLFRYLVLMKTGGVYADVDIMLDATLDMFITPTMSFFAPRDVVGEYAEEPFCLWNGLVGAAPAHPFIVRAVERLVNLILDRSDLYDMERDICRNMNHTMELWKVRAAPLLLFSGPCALGVAANEAMNLPSLQKFEIGWIGLDNLGFAGKKDHGDAFIMVGDKFDIGAFRISDPERNLIVASTDLAGVTKVARNLTHMTDGEKRRKRLRKRQLPHYSDSARGVFIWGSENVYKDKLVTNERIKFNVRYEDAQP